MKRKREKIYIQIEQTGNTQTKNRELADEWSRLKILTETVLNFRFKETILNRWYAMHIRYAKMGLLGTSFQGSNAIKRRFLILGTREKK